MAGFSGAVPPQYNDGSGPARSLPGRRHVDAYGAPVIICGRDLSAELLQRLRQQAVGLSVRKLGRWPCEALGWVGPCGQPQISVAVELVQTLVKQGILGRVGGSPPSCAWRAGLALITLRTAPASSSKHGMLWVKTSPQGEGGVQVTHQEKGEVAAGDRALGGQGGQLRIRYLSHL